MLAGVCARVCAGGTRTREALCLTVRGQGSTRQLKQLAPDLDGEHALVGEDVRNPGDVLLRQRFDRHCASLGGRDGSHWRRLDSVWSLLCLLYRRRLPFARRRHNQANDIKRRKEKEKTMERLRLKSG